MMTTARTSEGKRGAAASATPWPFGSLALAALLALAGGCTRHVDYDAFVQDPKPAVSTTEYRLAPPDVIAITSRRVHEINTHTETIRPDGKITLPLLGSVYVAGKTCEEASAELQKLAQEYYEDADVSLRVYQFASKHIYVFGEVIGAGAYQYTGTNTVLETLARAQPTRLADRSRIEILRPSKDGKLVRRMTIDLDQMVQEGQTQHDGQLAEGDIVYVPPTVLAEVGLALQQLLLPIQPAAATVAGPGQIGGDMHRVPYGNGAGNVNP
jgi:protein involved in polysaccharide export with SLBB domain